MEDVNEETQVAENANYCTMYHFYGLITSGKLQPKAIRSKL